jgi:hypothetical protein
MRQTFHITLNQSLLYITIFLQSGVDERVPMGVLGAFGILGGLSVLLLPETGDRPMAATLQEGEQLPRYR